MSGWDTYQHKPTRVQAKRFTAATRDELRALLTAELGPARFSMTATHLLISTSQGDSRDVSLGGWVIKRRTNVASRRPEFYPVEDEVMRDYERVQPSHRRRMFGRRPR